MACPKCKGKGRIILTDTDRVKVEGFPIIVPCPDCRPKMTNGDPSPSDAVLDRLHKF